MVDADGQCSKFLGFLWEIDCGDPNCPTSKNGSRGVINSLEWFLTHMARPRKNGNTFSADISIGASEGGVMAGKSYAISADTSFNYAAQKTTTSGASTGAGGSLGLALMYTNASDVQDLEGYSDSYGFTIVGIGGVAIDYITFVPRSNPDTTCWGINVTIAAGGEMEFHTAQNYTASSKSWNPFLKLRDMLPWGQNMRIIKTVACALFWVLFCVSIAIPVFALSIDCISVGEEIELPSDLNFSVSDSCSGHAYFFKLQLIKQAVIW